MADVLSTPSAPALSATSDMPSLPAASSDTPSSDTPNADAGAADPAADAAAAAAEPAEGDAAEPAAAAVEEPGEQPGGDKARPPKKGITERFSDLTAKRNDAEARAAAANENVTRLTATLETQSKQLGEALEAIKTAGGSKEGDAIQAAQDADPRPKRDAFDHPDQYEESLVQWSVRQGVRTAAAEFERKLVERDQATTEEARKKADDDAKADQQRQFEETTKVWGERRADAIKQIPDYEAVAESPDVMVSPHMGAIIVHSELGPQMAYHLGKNPQEAARIAALPLGQQIFEMGRISAAVTQSASKTKQPPEPITPTGPRAAATKKSVDEMSGDEYYEKRQAESARRK